MTELRFKIAWVTSLLLAIAAALLWIRSDRGSSQFAFSTAHARYTFRSEEGRLWLMGPPRPGPADQQRKGWDLLRRLKNEDISWDERYHDISPQLIANSAAAELDKLHRPEILLRGLDSPRKFAGSHILLMRLYKGRPVVEHGFQSGDSLVADFWHLKVELLHHYDTFGPLIVERRGSNTRVNHYEPDAVRIDASQQTAIRDFWHRVLDTKIVSIHYAWIVAALLILPVVAFRRMRKQRSRLRTGLCLACGYDLRASPGVCPECGAAARH